MQTDNSEHIQTKADLLEEANTLANQISAFIEKLKEHGPRTASYGDVYLVPKEPLLDQRWISIGVTDLQKGFMAIRRGISHSKEF